MGKKKDKKPKKTVVFNESDRVEFITGESPEIFVEISFVHHFYSKLWERIKIL